MSDLKDLALEIFEERKEFVEKENEKKKHEVDVEYEKSMDITKKAVEGILNIFKASNKENNLDKVELVSIYGQIGDLKVKVSFSESWYSKMFLDYNSLDDESSFIMLRNHTELKKAMKEFEQLFISEKKIKFIYNYFTENLSDYFEIDWISAYNLKIKIKKP